ncbi:MAG: bifunctional aminoglycoside phosphotransferase/ATP-binding protein [Ramlibacter sp.]
MQSSDPVTLARALVTALVRVRHAQLIETHISWVLLAGDHAYKIKKPVKLPFVDYQSLEARRNFCEEELRLNKRLAPSLYLGVTRITGSHRAPSLDGPGAALEYAVHMKRFPAGALFGERVAAQSLTANEVDALAALLADFHDHAPRDGEAVDFATPARRRAVALAALEGSAALATKAECVQLCRWIETEAAALAPLWAARIANGRIRECHGDLHLDNIVALDGGVAAFDCIEFDPALRWIDVLDDVAFAVMDFAARGLPGFAFRLLNGWLDRNGDHAALPALRFAVVSRALVRAQVEQLRGTDAAAARRYLELALAWTRPRSPHLFITYGLPGSGKTHESQRVLEREGAIRLRSDVERKRLFGLGMLDDSRAKGLDLYGKGATQRTYEHLFATARLALQAGYPVVLDAAFLRRDERLRALTLAHDCSVPLAIIACEAPLHVLRERLRARQGDASEADVTVLDQLLEIAEPLSELERTLVEVR